MKKLFPDDKSPKNGVLEFLDKKGFYIVLILCIAVVAGTAVYVTSQKAANDRKYNAERIIPEDSDSDSAADVAGSVSTPTQASSVASDDNKVASNDTTKATEKNNSTTKPTVTPTPKPKTVTPVDKASTSKNTATAKVDFSMPVSGSVTFDYSAEKLVYSKTLDEWRVHEGVDIAAEKGAAVKAAADGVVSEIKHDPGYGIIVVIEHKNGLKTVYANLATDDVVSPNQKISKGDVIGTIGTTAAFEASEPSHLHFEVLKDNENVNPSSYIPVKQVSK